MIFRFPFFEQLPKKQYQKKNCFPFFCKLFPPCYRCLSSPFFAPLVLVFYKRPVSLFRRICSWFLCVNRRGRTTTEKGGTTKRKRSTFFRNEKQKNFTFSRPLKFYSEFPHSQPIKDARVHRPAPRGPVVHAACCGPACRPHRGGKVEGPSTIEEREAKREKLGATHGVRRFVAVAVVLPKQKVALSLALFPASHYTTCSRDTKEELICSYRGRRMRQREPHQRCNRTPQNGNEENGNRRRLVVSFSTSLSPLSSTSAPTKKKKKLQTNFKKTGRQAHAQEEAEEAHPLRQEARRRDLPGPASAAAGVHHPQGRREQLRKEEERENYLFFFFTLTSFLQPCQTIIYQRNFEP